MVRLVIRNFEPHEARATRLVASRGAVFYLDPKHTKGAMDKTPLRTRDIAVRIAPAPAHDVAIVLMAKGVKGAKDIRVKWHWLDGEPL
ncbi:hypothetical protein ACFSYD_08865 [Paracoccus aerius]|nr:hypothetical protein GCM10017322_28470 [Paracoccus aerius]